MLDEVNLTAKQTLFFKLIPAIFTFVLFVAIAPIAQFGDYQRMFSFEQQVFGAWLLMIGGGFMFEFLGTLSALRKNKTTARMGAIVLFVIAIVSIGYGLGIFSGQYSPLGGTSQEANLFLATVLGLSVIMFVAHGYTEIFHHKRFLHALAEL